MGGVVPFPRAGDGPARSSARIAREVRAPGLPGRGRVAGRPRPRRRDPRARPTGARRDRERIAPPALVGTHAERRSHRRAPEGLHLCLLRSTAPGRGLAGPMSLGRRERQKVEIVALDGLSLEVAPGELFGLLGPNGAGKSTTVGVLTTRVRPTGGRAFIGDRDVWRDPVAVKRSIGVVPQRPNLDFSLTAREVLLFHGAYFGMSARTRTARAAALLDRFQLTDRANDLPSALLGRHDAAAVDRARHDARPGGALPRRAVRRTRPADASAPVGDRPRVSRTGADDRPDHAQHGGGRRAVPARRDRGPRQGDRARISRGIEALDPGGLRHSPRGPAPARLAAATTRAPPGRHRGARRRRKRDRPLRGPRRPARARDRQPGPARARRRSTTSTSRSLPSRTSFCTTPGGACGTEADEPQDLLRSARPGRARRPPELLSPARPDAAPADAARLRPREGPDDERHDAGRVQEPAPAGHHRPLDAARGHPGRRDAAHLRVPVHPRDRGPAPRAHRESSGSLSRRSSPA